MAKRLKVYRADAGFYETVVAAPNQAEALKAWGVRQNLFAEDAAEVEDDPDIVKTASAHPGQPLRRPIGSKEAFRLDPHAPTAPKNAKAKPKARVDRRKLDAAEAALHKLGDRQKAEAADLDRRMDDLKTERAVAESRWDQEQAEARKTVDRERRAYAKVGGQ
jgi:hypothetical protein